VLQEGVYQGYGRGSLRSYLHLSGHIVQEYDVRDTVSRFNPQGTEARRRIAASGGVKMLVAFMKIFQLDC
jgi:hypothetical protein